MRRLLFSDIFRSTTMGSQDGGRWLAKAASGGFTISSKGGIFDELPCEQMHTNVLRIEIQQ